MNTEITRPRTREDVSHPTQIAWRCVEEAKKTLGDGWGQYLGSDGLQRLRRRLEARLQEALAEGRRCLVLRDAEAPRERMARSPAWRGERLRSRGIPKEIRRATTRRAMVYVTALAEQMTGFDLTTARRYVTASGDRSRTVMRIMKAIRRNPPKV